MIDSIEIKGFRILNNFQWKPKEGVNIIVGTNSVGKSTVLDAIELVTKGTLHGLRARGNISPDWFNMQMVSQFFEAVKNGQPATPPEISISVTLSGDRALSHLKGCNGPHGVAEDKPGLWIRIRVPDQLMTSFIAETTSIASTHSTPLLPTEFYECVWTSYKGDTLLRRSRHVSCSRVDTSPEPYSRAVDTLARSLIEAKLDDEQLRKVSGAVRDARAQIDTQVLAAITVEDNEILKAFKLQMDKSPRSDWKNSVVLARENIPLAALGSADQVMAKAAASIASTSESPVLLMEEPECHLSHTTLRTLITIINSAIATGQQAFVTTHSPFVLNRLGLDRMFVLADGGNPETLGSLSTDTVNYFKRLSGYDTLRIVLADKTVLVEGPADEMVFDWAFHKLRGVYPDAKNIDVIEYGIRYKRAFELAAAVGKKPLAALRDHDDQDERHWKDAVAHLEKPDERKLFVGHDGHGKTLEPQMVMANQDNLQLLASIVGSRSYDEGELLKYMHDNKTLWSLRLIEHETEESEKLEVPAYIKEAIEFIDPQP